jgi:glycosyltransferase involved in cell wall biosynthesis
MEANPSSRIVLVHDWLTGMRGGEKCLEVLCQRWPDAPLFTLLHKRGAVAAVIEDRPIHGSIFRFLPKVESYYRYLLPLMPLAARWPLPNCDLVISLSHCVAKAACPPPGVPHLCYCFTPMRYAWHMRQSYFSRQGGGLKARLVDHLLARLRDWDRSTASRVTHFAAISRTVQGRIAECYDRDSRVIYPPVDTDFYTPGPVLRQDHYLVVSAFAPYKRIDLAIAACRKLGRKLVIIGKGQQEKQLRAMAGPEVQLLGWQSDEVVRDHMRRCRALLFPGEEDFGIVPVEAQACGTPVVAFGRGGATETIVQGSGRLEPTGLLFEEQTPDCLAGAMQQFEKETDHFSPLVARRNAQRFNRRRFGAEIFGFIEEILQQRTALPARRAA